MAGFPLCAAPPAAELLGALETALAPVHGPIAKHMSGSRRAIDRARYLGEQLHATIWHELGLAGRHMTQWLLAVLDEVDTQRRPAGASAHLLLDLYERQGRKLAAFLARQPPPRSDVLQTQAALQLLEQDMPAAPHAVEQDWTQTRQYVLQALWPLAQDETMLERSGYPQAQTMLTQMVQQSSRQLAALGALD